MGVLSSELIYVRTVCPIAIHEFKLMNDRVMRIWIIVLVYVMRTSSVPYKNKKLTERGVLSLYTKFWPTSMWL